MVEMPIMLVGLYVFVLATLAGKEVITKVPPTLHTPLMSGANAISGIALIGALIVSAQAEFANQPVVVILGFVSIVFATINVVGGFLVTDRMLEMFKKK
jgi:NAD(P) transhydrogenase subunit alpha